MIWPLFDNRREKKNAYAEYRKLKPDKQLAEAMRDALTREREHRQQAARLGVFVPEQKHPKRWLKAQCWNDELENLDEKPQRHGQGREPIDTTKPVSIDGIWDGFDADGNYIGDEGGGDLGDKGSGAIEGEFSRVEAGVR